MGTCSTRSAGRIAANVDQRPDRPFAQLYREEKRMVDSTVKHLRTVVPALLAHAYDFYHVGGDADAALPCSEPPSELPVEARRASESTAGGGEAGTASNTAAFVDAMITTFRRTLIRYSDSTTDHGWFTCKLLPGEAMHILNCYLTDSVKEELTSLPLGEQLLDRFQAVYADYLEEAGALSPGPGKGRNALRGPHWAVLAELTDFFMRADKDHSGGLSLEEIRRIIHDQNIGISQESLAAKMRVADADGNMSLVYKEFIAFYETLTYKRYVQDYLFKQLTCGRHFLSSEQFASFLVDVQKDPRGGSPQQCNALLKQLEKLKMAVREHRTARYHMSDRMFAHFVTSIPLAADEEKLDLHNSCFDPAKTTAVYHDMKQPMTDYFIASSHNTYLETHQLYGVSSATAYQNAMELGCRCLELDCWDGPDGEPIVYHGYTQTTKVSFAKVIDCINQHAFKRSPYPVILSLEVHCSLPQQKRMGAIMKQYFVREKDGQKHSILHPPIAFTNHTRESKSFTPTALRGYILVKGKMLGSKDGAAFREHLLLVEQLNASQKVVLKTELGADDSAEEDDAEAGSEEMQQMKERMMREAGSHEKKTDVSPELSSCVWMKSVGFRGCEQTLSKGNHWDVSSFTEDKIASLYKKDRKGFGEANKIVFSRVYPAGSRIDSSNYWPQVSWNVGCQIVALNYQIAHNRSDALRQCLGKFSDNGRCGYLLKPRCLRARGVDIDGFEDPCSLHVTVIQGFKLPKPGKTRKGEVIDPYVMCFVSGADRDCGGHADAPHKNYYRTKYVHDNGWNPEWFEATEEQGQNQSPRTLSPTMLVQTKTNLGFRGSQPYGNKFQFNLVSREMATLTIRVMDHDTMSADDFIGEAVIPLSVLREGYRAVPLHTEDYVALDSSVLCNFEFKPFSP